MPFPEGGFILPVKSKVSSSHSLILVFATLTSLSAHPVLEMNLIPTSLITDFQTITLMIRLLEFHEKVSKSDDP